MSTSPSIQYERFTVTLRRATSKAILVAYEGEEQWLPRTLIDTLTDRKIDNTESGAEISIRLMTWKAAELGWVEPNIEDEDGDIY